MIHLFSLVLYYCLLVYLASHTYFLGRITVLAGTGLGLLLPTEYLELSVGRFVTLVSAANTAELIEMPFGLRTLLAPGNHALGGPEPNGKGQFLGGKGVPL